MGTKEGTSGWPRTPRYILLFPLHRGRRDRFGLGDEVLGPGGGLAEASERAW